MAKSAAQHTGLLRRVAPYMLPTQRAMIYKAIIRSKMEYASSAWFGATPTSLSQLDAVQRRAIRIIDLGGWPHLSPNSATGNPKRSWSPHIVPPYYGEAPELLCQLLPEHLQLDPRLRRSVRSHDLANTSFQPSQPQEIFCSISSPHLEFSTCMNTFHL